MDFVDCRETPPTDGTEAALDRLYGRPGSCGTDERAAEILDLVGSVASPPGLLHDHGCGNGQVLLEAARRGWTAQGNDLVGGPAVPLGRLGIRFLVGPLPRLEPASCDVVTSMCVLPHVTEPRVELEAIHRLLRRGGWLVAQMPSDRPYRRIARMAYRLSFGRWSWILLQVYSPAHRFAFDPTSIAQLLESVGFELTSTRPYRQRRALSLRRFSRARAPVRVLAGAVVRLADVLSDGRPNHIGVIARKPGLEHPQAAGASAGGGQG